ncbi:phage tail protein [Sunxiuqinia elliptica]
MSEPFLAEIRIVGFNFAPRGWAFCDGQILPINQNQSLYSLLGTTYGGDGQTSFALPDLRGRSPVHPNNSTIQPGAKSGAETHTLTANELPAHTHKLMIAETEGTKEAGSSPSLSQSKNEKRYTTAQPQMIMNPNGVAQTGEGQAHDNMQPSLAVYYCIALQGLFPSRS